MFNLSDALTIVAVVVNLILGFLVFLDNPKKALNISFAVFAFITSAWVFSNFLFEIIPNMFILKTQYALGAAVMPLAFLWIFLILEKKITTLKAFLIALAGIVIVILPYVDGLLIKNFSSSPEGLVFATGYLFNYYSVFILLFYLFLVYELVSGIKNNSYIKKVQLQYILMGALTFGGVTVLVNFILPFFKIVPVAPYDAQSSVFYLGFVAYAITKHHLFNVKVIATELLTFSIWITLLVKIFVAGSTQEIFLNIFIFLIVVVFGILLIRSVINEVKQKEKMEQMARDISRAYEVEKKANEELKNLDVVKNQFLLTIQHHLRTPLTSMRGYADLLLEGAFGKVPVKIVSFNIK